MALYLGNQKVSLRSGQDPTFDYGFDSNGRLVFANKNAKEINNFLNYDSSYSEILDLSNLSKMEKVAVNGTADRKMEGLKGLLVSPNAPFTGSSPQINASYTGLSKSALVSLFESAPYNVGYTKVGAPTIVDGVVSGFSGGDYLKTSTFSVNRRWKVVVKFKYTETTGTKYVIGNANTFLIKTYNNYLAASIKENGSSSWDFNKAFSKTLQDGEVIWFCLEFDGTKYDMSYSSDGDSYTILDTYTSSVNISPNHNINFGSVANEVFPGSIDLNETYIKVNGVPWFGPGATKNLVPAGTVVGDVTIKDGVASGFSGSDYLQILSALDVSKPFEVFLKITTGTSEALQYPVRFVGTNSVFAIDARHNHRPIFLMRYYGTDGALHSCDTYSSTVSFADNTSYYVRCLCDANGISLSYSTDNTNWTTRTTPLPADFVSWQQPTGVYLSDKEHPFDGSIDLNNTYIKVGSDYFYRGMVPMTKTCSIVGATGTSDLTQEDKNIILNKGWSLTVQ